MCHQLSLEPVSATVVIIVITVALFAYTHTYILKQPWPSWCNFLSTFSQLIMKFIQIRRVLRFLVALALVFFLFVLLPHFVFSGKFLFLLKCNYTVRKIYEPLTISIYGRDLQQTGYQMYGHHPFLIVIKCNRDTIFSYFVTGLLASCFYVKQKTTA